MRYDTKMDYEIILILRIDCTVEFLKLINFFSKSKNNQQNGDIISL